MNARPEDIPNAPRSRKRQRVSRACDSCRDRKTACDGRRPVCMACESRDATDTCRYTFIPKRESEHWRSGSLDEGVSPKRLRPLEPLQSQDPVRNKSTENRGLSTETPLEEAFSSAPSDGLATFDQAAYGPSSTVAFLRHIIARGSRAATPHGESSRAKRRSGAIPSWQLERVRGLESSQAVLPLRRNADDFVGCYWEFIHPMFPLLHRTTFVDQYERLWAGEDDRTAGGLSRAFDIEEPVFMAILNLVFALGCKLSSLVSASRKAAVADDFYQKSRLLAEFLIIDATSVSTVQLLALSGVYLQSTPYASRCWNSVGLAIRAAQSLGMHCEGSGRAVSQLEREMGRRVWHTCVSLDRLLSMTFGRPCMISKPNDVALPLMIDDEYLSTTQEGQQPRDMPSRLGAFVFSRKLFELLGQVLDFLSSPALQNTSQAREQSQMSDFLTQVLDLNRRLDSFTESVPPYLRKSETTSPYAPQPTSNENHIHLQQRVLHCRLMLVRLLLLRPLLLMSTRVARSSTIHALDGTTQPSLDADLVKNCCNLCLKTAYRLVDAIYFNLNTLYRSSGWHAVYFSFSAAIVLLASLKCPLVDCQVGDEKFESCWARCMAVFEHYRDQIQSAPHIILLLRAIRRQMTQGSEAENPALDSNHTTTQPVPAEGPPTTFAGEAVWPDLGYDGSDPFGFNNISDAWFGQQLTNLDWLEIPQF